MAHVLRDQVCMQDRVNASLGANDLLENAHALSRLTPLPLSFVVRDPDLWEKAARVEFGQYRRIDLVGLHSSISDCANHARIRHDHPLDEGPQDPLDSCAVACGLDNDLVLNRQRLRKLDELIANEFDSLLPLDLPVLQERRL